MCILNYFIFIGHICVVVRAHYPLCVCVVYTLRVGVDVVLHPSMMDKIWAIHEPRTSFGKVILLLCQ